MLEQPVAEGEMQPVVNPAEPKDIVGYVREASDAEVQQALTSAINRMAARSCGGVANQIGALLIALVSACCTSASLASRT